MSKGFKSDAQRKAVMAMLRKSKGYGLGVAYPARHYFDANISGKFASFILPKPLAKAFGIASSSVQVPKRQSQNVDTILNKLVGKRDTGSGMGFGERDVSWDFKNLSDRRRAQKILGATEILYAGRRVPLKVSTWHYRDISDSMMQKVKRYLRSRKK